MMKTVISIVNYWKANVYIFMENLNVYKIIECT